MKYYRETILKDGRSCVIRSAGVADAGAVISSLKKMHAETDFLLAYPDEKYKSVEEEGCFLQSMEESEREAMLLAFVGDELVGSAGLTGIGSREKLLHRAEFGISVLRDYWGNGIGRALITDIIACAEKAGYTQLELEVVGDNERAAAIYKSFGFTECGRNPRGFRMRNGEYRELVMMILFLDKD